MLNKIKEAKEYLLQYTSQCEVGIVLGSGLSNFVDNLEVETTIPYGQIPHFPQSTVKGHKGMLVFGTIGGKRVVCMQGRFHYYEGYTMQEVTFPIRVMKAIGIHTLIVTNAAGGVNPDFKVGDIMLIKDHINQMPNPLIGKNFEELGTRFPSMSTIYNQDLREKAKIIAKAENITLQEGVYLATTGPSFETPAEYKFFRTIGADAIGMSTVPEVIVASHSNLNVLGMSVISNVFNPNAIAECTHEEVLEGVSKAGDKMSRIVKRLFE
mgnify:FL=1